MYYWLILFCFSIYNLHGMYDYGVVRVDLDYTDNTCIIINMKKCMLYYMYYCVCICIIIYYNNENNNNNNNSDNNYANENVIV